MFGREVLCTDAEKLIQRICGHANGAHVPRRNKLVKQAALAKLVNIPLRLVP
jgi:hypothetical protein